MPNSHRPRRHGDGPDRVVVAGFVNPNRELGYGATKIVAGRLRARMVAVDAWVMTGQRLSHQVLANRLEMSGRCLSYQFADHNALYAFPPPELARSLTSTTASVTDWDQVAALTVPVFEALETNPGGRVLMAGLVRLHRAHPDLCDTDGYFAHALRDAIINKRPRHTLAITGLFTDGIRIAFQDWVDNGEPSLEFVAERVTHIIQGPVQQAYNALNQHN